MKFIPVLILSIFLTGCACFKKHDDVPAISPKTVNIEKSALEQCPDLNENIVVASFEDALVVYGDLATMYARCAGKQATSVKLLKQFGNVK